MATSKGTKDNLSAVLYGIGDLRLEQRPIPEINDDEVLLEMACVGICGTDKHFFNEGHFGDYIIEKPMIIGHEASGTVAGVGKAVRNLQVGDRVAIEQGVACRKCALCKAGRYNLCKDMVFCGLPPHNGKLTRYSKHAADFCYKLPPHVTMEEGAMLEPLSVGVHACRRADVGLGSHVLILGAGPIGLVTLATALSMGAAKVVITDFAQHRLEMAKKLGATETIIISKCLPEESIIRRVYEVLGDFPDKTIDCVGHESTVHLGIMCTRPGGCLVLVGLMQDEIKMPTAHALVREIDMRGAFCYCNDYPLAMSLIANNVVNLKPLVTHHFDISETRKAFETALNNSIKTIIHVKESAKEKCTEVGETPQRTTEGYIFEQ